MLPGNTTSMTPAAPTGRTPMVASPPPVQAQHPVAPAATVPQAPPSAGPVSPSPSRHPEPTTHIAPPAPTTQVPPMMTSHDAAPTDTPETLSNPAVVSPAPPKRIPRALRALMPYNQPGLQETTTVSYEPYIPEVPEPMHRTTRIRVSVYQVP